MLEQALADQEARWRSGDRVRVEPLLESHAALKPMPEAVLELICNEVVLREESGEHPTLAEYQKRFPALAEVLRIQWAIDAAMISRRVRRKQSTASPETVSFGSTRTAESLPANVQRIGRYEIQSVLGKGGMGIAYKAWDPQLKRVVALKMIKAGEGASEDDIARFRTEAAAIAKIRHTHIVQIYDVGEYEGQPYFAMEYCGGGSLAERLKPHPLAPRDAAVCVEQIARGVAAAHEEKIIHRDLKPANVLLLDPAPENADGAKSTTAVNNKKTKKGTSSKSQQGSSSKTGLANVCKVTDFGLAKHLDSDDGRTRTGVIMGTPSYMPPEQAFGQTKKLTARADVFSIGAILYECLTGTPPFRGATVAETLDQVRNQEPVPIRRLLPKTPLDLETIALKCLNKEPARRYENAQEVADELERFLEGRPILARPAGRLERTWRWCRRNPAVASLLLMCGLFLAVLIVGWAIFTFNLEEQRSKATKNAQIANDKTAIARRTEQNLIKHMDELAARVADKKHSGIPGMEEFRKELLTEVVEAFKEQLKYQDDPDPELRRQAGLAYQRASKWYGLLGDAKKRLEYLLEAERVQRTLVVEPLQNPEYLADLATTLQNLSNGSTNGQALLSEAKALRTRLVELEPANSRFLTSLARTETSFGIHYRKLNDTAKAEQSYLAALHWCAAARKLAPTREEMLLNQGLAHSNFSVFYFNLGSPAKAIEQATASVKAHEDLVKAHNKPENREKVADAHRVLAQFMTAANQFDQSIAHAEEASKKLQALHEEFPGLPSYLASYMHAKVVLSGCLGNAGRPADAERELLPAQGYYKKFASQSIGAKFQFEYAKSLSDHGFLLINLKNTEEAKLKLTESIAMLQRTPPTLHKGMVLGQAHMFMGKLHAELNEPTEARKWYQQAIKILEPESRKPSSFEARRNLQSARTYLAALNGK